MDTNNTTARGDAQRRRAQRRLTTLGDLEVEHHAEERLVRRREQERRTETGQLVRIAQQLQRLGRGLAEIERGADLRALRAADVMHRQPKVVGSQALAVDAADLMEEHRITSVLVVDAQGLLVGALNSNDLMRAKVI